MTTPVQDVDGKSQGFGLGFRIGELDGKVTLRHGSYRHRLRADSNDGQIVVDDEFSFGTEIQLQDGGDLLLGDSRHGEHAGLVRPDPQGRR